MTLLCIFPHPDDESFGPAPLLWKLRQQGHAIHLLTLTRGENTRQRERLGVSKEEMGRIRSREMACMAQTLDLSSLEILDFADGALAQTDPLRLEEAVAASIHRHAPDVVVTYPIHGISGHPDHLAGHAAVKRVFCALRRDRSPDAPRRLAFFCLPPTEDADRPAHLRATPWDKIGVVESVSADDLAHAHHALACYETYQTVIQAHQPLRQVEEGVCFELFDEPPMPRRESLLDGIDQ